VPSSESLPREKDSSGEPLVYCDASRYKQLARIDDLALILVSHADCFKKDLRDRLP
jgi:hypothetical protein